MAVNRGWALRHLGRMSLVFAYLVEAMTHPLPSTQAAQTCFGKAATIADHHGDIAGTAGDDVMIGDNGDNDFESNGGTDYICGLGGDDMVGYQFNAVIYAEGGPGNDWLLGGNSGNELHGGGGADQLTGHNGLDLLYGDGGNDLLFGAGGQDFIHGGNGQDDLYGGDGNDHLFGEGDPDRLIGGDGFDAFSGGGGADKCYTGAFSDGFFDC
jgi:Ca2+-binding RTX toxin-like protein